MTDQGTKGEKAFRCRKCGKSGDVKWLATHGHSRLGAFVLGLMGRALPKEAER